MKLHLPKGLRKALIACMTVVGCIAYTGTQAIAAPNDGVKNTVTVTTSDVRIDETAYGSEDEITFNLMGYLQMQATNTIVASVIIDKLIINNGSSTNNAFTFTNTITGEGFFSGGFKQQHYTFNGSMSGYSGDMLLVHDNSSFTFSKTSGTGAIVSQGTTNVSGATMKNSSIFTKTLSVSGGSSFEGDVTTTSLSLSNSAIMSIAAGKTLSTTGTITGSGQLTFGENAVLNVTGMMTGSGLVHETFGYKTDTAWTGDVLGTGVTATAPTKVIVDGVEGTMATDGTVSLTDTNYYIIGATTSSAILASNDNIASSSAVKIDNASSALTVDADITLPKLQATLGTISLTKNLTVTGASSITGTTVEGTGELIVADGATLQVNSTAQKLKSNIRVDAGGTMQFLGAGADAINYGQTGRTIYVDGTMDVGYTRQTVGNWKFELTGGTILGGGQFNNGSFVGLDFHSQAGASTITAKALTGATAATPTTSTISTNVRYSNSLTLSVEENARLDINGIHGSGASGKLSVDIEKNGELYLQHKGGNNNIDTLTGSGNLTLASSDSDTRTTYIKGGSNYSGTVKVQSLGTGNRIDLDVASDTALANAVVELGGGANDKSNNITNLVLGGSTVSVKGIKDAADRKSAGDVIIRTDTVPSTLTINTAGNSYSTKSGVKKAISLVKTGEGTQSFSGDMSTFNKAITVNAGTLEFLKEATNLNVTQLTVAGGNLTVKGTVYTSDTLSYTSGKIAANLNVKNSTTLTLNGTVDMTGTLTLGNSLTLNGSKLTEILALTEGGRVDLFSGVSTLILGGTNYQAGALTENNGLAFGDCFSYTAPMSATSGGDIYLGFDANGMVYAGMRNIPEPTTATLSLLALAALAARRRRK